MDINNYEKPVNCYCSLCRPYIPSNEAQVRELETINPENLLRGEVEHRPHTERYSDIVGNCASSVNGRT